MEGNNSEGENELNPLPSPLQGEGAESLMQPKNQLSQNLPQNLPPQGLSQENIEKILNLIKLVYQYASEHGVKESELEKLISNLEQVAEE